MRIIVFILTLVCFFNLTANSVYIDTVYCNYYNNLVKQKQLIVNYKLKNISDEDYLTWVSITPVEKKSDRELVYEFFKQRKGDFSWLQMMYEGLLETQIMNVGYSFIKNIHPNETFSYYVCKIDKKSFFYEDRIVIIQKKKVEQYLKEKFDDKYFFQLPYIVLIDGKIESRILTDNGYAVPDSAGGYDYYYYVKDYQGNIRAVLDEEDNVMESNGYYPYGMPYADNYFSVQPYKYGGKELDRTNGLDMYDFGARWYDMIVPHFITMDELCEKYPSISPYAYCAGNPIRYVDPTGRKIISHEDNSIGFNMKYGVARKYIMDNGMGDHLKKIADDENIILYIKDNSNGKGGSYFDADNNTLYLDLNNAAVFENGKSVSPAVIVVHELDHIQRYYYDNKGYLQDVNTNDGQYKNKEEKRVIEGSEQDAARKFGEIEENETTRTNHNVKEFKPVDEPYKKWNDERNF